MSTNKKDNLIRSPLYFIKTKKKENDASGICFQLLQIPKQIYKTHFYFDIDCFIMIKKCLDIHLFYIVHVKQ